MQALANKQRAAAVSVRGCARPARTAVVRCVASQSSRRDALIGVGAVLVSPLIIVQGASAKTEAKYNVKYLPVDKLGAFQKNDQRKEFKERAEQAIMQYLTADDAPACVRLALEDAGTYDYATKAGGANGAVISNPPSSLKPLIGKLRKAKQAIDEGDKNGSGPISWADLIYLAGKTTTQAAWKAAKVKNGGAKAAAQSGNEWPVVLGRVDSDVAGPNKVPAEDAPVEEIRAYLLALGANPDNSGFFAPKAPFWEKPGFLIWTAAAADPAAEESRLAAANQQFADAKRTYDISRDTVSRTDYEVDFAAVYNKLTNLGANINPKAYLYPQPILAAKI